MGDSPSQEALGNVWDGFWLSQWWEVGVGHPGYLEDQVPAPEGTTSAHAKLPHISADFLMFLWTLRSMKNVFINSIFPINTKLFFMILIYTETYN